MSGTAPIEKVVERAIRRELERIDALDPSVRISAMKLGLDYLRYKHKIDEQGELGAEFRDQNTDEDALAGQADASV